MTEEIKLPLGGSTALPQPPARPLPVFQRAPAKKKAAKEQPGTCEACKSYHPLTKEVMDKVLQAATNSNQPLPENCGWCTQRPVSVVIRATPGGPLCSYPVTPKEMPACGEFEPKP